MDPGEGGSSSINKPSDELKRLSWGQCGSVPPWHAQKAVCVMLADMETGRNCLALKNFQGLGGAYRCSRRRCSLCPLWCLPVWGRAVPGQLPLSLVVSWQELQPLIKPTPRGWTEKGSVSAWLHACLPPPPLKHTPKAPDQGLLLTTALNLQQILLLSLSKQAVEIELQL